MGTATLADSRTGPAGSQPRGSPGWLARGLRLLSVPIALLPLLGAQDAAPKPVEPNGDSGAPSISDDGRFVVFESLASNFVAGDQKDTWDVFLFDRESGVVSRVSEPTPFAARSPQISGDGRWITFLQAQAKSPELAITYGGNHNIPPWKVGLHDRDTGSLLWIGGTWHSVLPEYPPDSVSITRDGGLVTFSERVSDIQVVKLFDRGTGKSVVASLSPRGTPSKVDARQPRISRSGRYLAFISKDPNLSDPSLTELLGGNPGEWDHVMLRELKSNDVTCVNLLAYQEVDCIEARSPFITDDGRYVAYDHTGGGLMGAPHVGFVSDRIMAKAGRLIPFEPHITWWQGCMSITWLSADGPQVLIVACGVADMPEPLRGGPLQVYLRDIDATSWTLISRAVSGEPANAGCGGGVASRDLRTIAFWSTATNLVAGDKNNTRDVFIVDRKTGKISRIEARP